MIHMVFITEGFLEVAIESLPKWVLNPRPLNSVQTLWLSFQAMGSACTQSQLCTATPISSLVCCSHFILAIAFVGRYISFKRNLAKVIILVVEYVVYVWYSRYMYYVVYLVGIYKGINIYIYIYVYTNFECLLY